MLHANNLPEADAEGDTEQELKEWQSVEEIVKTEGPTSSQTTQDAIDVVHIFGDIIRVRLYLFVCEANRLISYSAHTYKNRQHPTTAIH
jgi:hypothetical protein